MLRGCSRAIAAVMLVALSPARAENTVVTLACNGTTTTNADDDALSKPVSMGIVIDLNAGTIDGFFGQFRAEISTHQTKMGLYEHYRRDGGRTSQWFCGSHNGRHESQNVDRTIVHGLRVEMQARTTDVLIKVSKRLP